MQSISDPLGERPGQTSRVRRHQDVTRVMVVIVARASNVLGIRVVAVWVLVLLKDFVMAQLLFVILLHCIPDFKGVSASVEL